MSTLNRQKTKAINVKYVDQAYGKSPVDKDGLFSLRVLSLKLQAPPESECVPLQNPSTTHRNERGEGYELAKEFDNVSQSQSSSQGKFLVGIRLFIQVSREGYKEF